MLHVSSNSSMRTASTLLKLMTVGSFRPCMMHSPQGPLIGLVSGVSLSVPRFLACWWLIPSPKKIHTRYAETKNSVAIPHRRGTLSITPGACCCCILSLCPHGIARRAPLQQQSQTRGFLLVVTYTGLVGSWPTLFTLALPRFQISERSPICRQSTRHYDSSQDI